MNDRVRNCIDGETDPLIWDDTYSVNAHMLDNQHKSLFSIINEVRNACISGADKQAMLTVINKLYDYSATHFRDEESVLRAKDSSLLEQQQTQHAIFLDYVISLEQKIQSDTEMVNQDILTFLQVWWEEHILKIDKQYSTLF